MMAQDTNRTTLRDLLRRGQIFVPCIWDSFTATAAELSGFPATLLSGGALSGSLGLPDIGLITADDLVTRTQFLCAHSALPCIIDADDGFGESPLCAYRLARRLAEAGAMGLTLDDTTGLRGYNRWGEDFRGGAQDGKMRHPVISREQWLAKIRAGLEATCGTDCLLIARTEAKLQYGLDEAIARCRQALDLGAEMTLIIGLKTLEEARVVAERVPGWKMWPDVMTTDGVPDVRLEDIAPLGFNLVTIHIFEKASMYGMLLFGKKTFADRTTVFCDTHDSGLSEEDKKKSIMVNGCLTGATDWLEMEKEFWRT